MKFPQSLSITEVDLSLCRLIIFRKFLCLPLFSGSCHLDRAASVETGVECQIFVIVIFSNCDRVLQFGAHSRYYKGALTQKRFLVLCTTFRSDFCVGWKNQNKYSTLNSSFDALSK